MSKYSKLTSLVLEDIMMPRIKRRTNRKDVTRGRVVENQHIPKGKLRNRPCPCKSGKKYKKCCGASSFTVRVEE